MLARFVLGTIAAGAVIMPALAGTMTADEARKFVAGKVFAFTCVDGTRGAGPIRHVRLPGNTLLIRGQSVCASLRGVPFEPCFNLDKTSEVSFRGSVSGMSFAYCDFHHQGGTQMLMARAVARSRSRHADRTGSIDNSRAEVTAGVVTPRVESSKLEPIKSEPKPESRPEAAKSEGSLELRRSTQ